MLLVLDWGVDAHNRIYHENSTLHMIVIVFLFGIFIICVYNIVSLFFAISCSVKFSLLNHSLTILLIKVWLMKC